MADIDGIDNALVEPEIEPKTPDAPKFTLEQREKLQEEKASGSGWKPLDEYVAAGGDPMTWKTAGEFNLFGELHGSFKRREADFERRLDGVHKLTQAQLAAQREQLMAQREELIDEGGRKKEVAALDRQINNLTTPVATSDPLLDNWNAQNAWIFEDSPKTDRAKSVFTKTVMAGKTTAEAIAAVEADIAKHFAKPDKPGYVPETERGRTRPGFGAGKAAVTMSDLTDDERLAWKHMSHAWKDEKEFLQAVADDRRAAAKGGK